MISALDDKCSALCSALLRPHHEFLIDFRSFVQNCSFKVDTAYLQMEALLGRGSTALWVISCDMEHLILTSGCCAKHLDYKMKHLPEIRHFKTARKAIMRKPVFAFQIIIPRQFVIAKKQWKRMQKMGNGEFNSCRECKRRKVKNVWLGG